MSKYKIVLVRHGESEWNKKNLFCGWVNVNLSDKGIVESKAGGTALKDSGIRFDIAYTSLLKRAHQTLNILLEIIGQPDLPVVQAWELNERHYGGLTGLNKLEAVKKYGKEQVQIWRRSFDVLPPPMEEDHPYYSEIVNNPIFSGLQKENFPKVESLETTKQRVIPYWTNHIVPQIKSGKLVLVVAHGTSLRGLVQHIEGISDVDVMKLNLPNGIPFVYDLNENVEPIGPAQFLADEDVVKEAIARVASVSGTSPADPTKKHGESEWNKENKFCGWMDAQLSAEGVKDSEFGASVLKGLGLKFNVAYTSLLKRAHQTLDILLNEMGQLNICVTKRWELNERHFGELTGMDRFEAVKIYGMEKVKLWRWGYDVPPPPITVSNDCYNQISDNPIFSIIKSTVGIPTTESFKDTERRVLFCWNNEILPDLKSGKRILVVAHGTSLRALIKHLNGVEDENFMSVQLPCGIPLAYHLDDDSSEPVPPGVYLADNETVQKSLERIVQNGGST